MSQDKLTELRSKIDVLDEELVRLFEERMGIVLEIAAEKKDSGLPVLNREREVEKLDKIAQKVQPEIEPYSRILYDTLFELSRSYQYSWRQNHLSLHKQIEQSIDTYSRRSFPYIVTKDGEKTKRAVVACQGVAGAFSQTACMRLFDHPNILYFNNFEKVFSAVENGFADYGVLPLENNTAGSVNRIYDLMQSRNRDFKIIRSLRLKIDHNLAVPKGVKKEAINEIISHEQALGQCAEFLEKNYPGVKVTEYENTATAAKAVSESSRRDMAAICSYDCIELYGLSCLETLIQDKTDNYTRFICISKNLEIYPDANKTSIQMVLPHRRGTLYKALAWFYALDINLLKLESRLMPGHDFDATFYLDLETPIYSEKFTKMLDILEDNCKEFRYLGTYLEIT